MFRSYDLRRMFLRREETYSCLAVDFSPLLSIPFFAGTIFGTIIGFFSDTSGELLTAILVYHQAPSGSPLFQSFFISIRFILISFVLSTSILGVVLLPALSAMRAFLFATSVACVLKQPTFRVYLLVFITVGLPLLMELPAFLLSLSSSFAFSSMLWSNGATRKRNNPAFFRSLLTVVLLSFAQAFYISCLLPRLLNLLS